MHEILPAEPPVATSTDAASGLPPVVEALRAARQEPKRPMRASFFEFQHKPSLVETAFELTYRHLCAGDSVTYRFLGYDVPNTYMSPVRGSRLIGRWLPERAAARLVAHPAFAFVPRTRLRRRPLPFDVPDSLESLMMLRHKGFDIGMAVASSLISQTRDSRFLPAERHALVRRVLTSALAVYEHVSSVIQHDRPDVVYVFNGRFAYERAVLRACQAHGVPCLLYEWGSSPDRFFLRPFSTHDRTRVQEEMRALWHAVADRRQASEQASQWFVERRERRPRDWPSFTTMQTRSRLPENLNPGRLIAYFSSSDDEYVAIGDEYRWRGWTNQLEAVSDLIRVVEALGNAHLVIRIHPHLMSKHPRERTRWMALDGTSPALTVIGPESDVDTYALMETANVVVTGGSTAGIEAVYWGRPSVLLGPSDYDELGAVHRPTDATSLAEMLRNPELRIDRDAALMYGYFRATFGEPYTVYQPESFHHGTFMGVDLRPKAWRLLAEMRQRGLRTIQALRQRYARIGQGAGPDRVRPEV